MIKSARARDYQQVIGWSVQAINAFRWCTYNCTGADDGDKWRVDGI